MSQNPSWWPFPSALGKIIALLVILAAFVLALMGKLSTQNACLFAAVGFAVLFS